MTEQMIVEAVKATGGSLEVWKSGGLDGQTSKPLNIQASDSAVGRFEAAMAADPVPFASEAAAAWRSAQANNQGILHRIRALSDLKEMHSPSVGNLVELQYEVMNLAFQQEVVTKVADKASNAIQTLVKNQ